MNKFLALISHGLHQIQRTFFPDLDHEAGPIPQTLIKFSYILQTIHFQKISFPEQCCTGRPLKSRRAIFNAFIAKSYLGMPTTVHLVERLQSDKHLRLICGFENRIEVPSESVFSRVFAEFAKTTLPNEIHRTLVEKKFSGEIIGHIARDSTPIEAREKSEKRKISTQVEEKPKKSRGGRRRKGETTPKELTRIQKQINMTLKEMLADLPQACNKGTKKNSKGYVSTWIGYKIHIDTADNGIPISALLTSASLNDSQAAIPLATITAERVQNFYDLMDSAYDVTEIKEHCRKLNHVPLIDVNPRSEKLKNELESEVKARKALNWKSADMIRYNERSLAERTNSRLKDEFGGSTVRVRGAIKVFCHLMIGILVITADQLNRLIL